MIGTRPPSWPYYLNPETTQAYGVVASYLGANGGNTLYDWGPTKSYHGTLTNGPTWTTGKFGEPAIAFTSASSHYADLGVSLSSLVNITAAAWIYPTALASGTAIEIIAKDHSTAGQRCWSLQADDTLRPYVFKNDSSATVMAGTGAALTLNTWQHVAFTYAYVADGTSIITSYINGVAKEQITSAVGPIQTGSNSINIGRRQYAGAEAYWPGRIAGAVICGIALNSNQIAELYRNPFLLYWQPSPVRTFWMGAAPAAPGGLSIPIAAYHYNHSLRA